MKALFDPKKGSIKALIRITNYFGDKPCVIDLIIDENVERTIETMFDRYKVVQNLKTLIKDKYGIFKKDIEIWSTWIDRGCEVNENTKYRRVDKEDLY